MNAGLRFPLQVQGPGARLGHWAQGILGKKNVVLSDVICASGVDALLKSPGAKDTLGNQTVHPALWKLASSALPGSPLTSPCGE